MLVEHGHIVKNALAKELLSRAELMSVLHRQGFNSLSEVDRCVLEPGGTFYIQRKHAARGQGTAPGGDEDGLGELRDKLDVLCTNARPGVTGAGYNRNTEEWPSG